MAREIVAVMFVLALMCGTALAQIGPPPGGPGGGGGGVVASQSKSGGSSGGGATGAVVQGVACLLGNAVLGVGKASANDYVLWNVGCALAGPVGGGGALALFQKDHGLFPRLFREGGLKCQEVDRGYVDGCAWWLDHHKPKLKAKHKRHKKKKHLPRVAHKSH